MIQFIKEGCKQLSPYLFGSSHQYCTYFQFYLWLNFLKLWSIALIDLKEDTGSYMRAANSYPPAYPGCHINTAHIFNFISAIYDWILKTLINCLNWLSRRYRFIQMGCKQLSPCLSWVSHQYCTHLQFYQRHLWLNFLKLWQIALIDLVDDTGAYRRAANSFPPAYPGCYINTALIFSFISAIYDWIL